MKNHRCPPHRRQFHGIKQGSRPLSSGRRVEAAYPTPLFIGARCGRSGGKRRDGRVTCAIWPGAGSRAMRHGHEHRLSVGRGGFLAQGCPRHDVITAGRQRRGRREQPRGQKRKHSRRMEQPSSWNWSLHRTPTTARDHGTRLEASQWYSKPTEGASKKKEFRIVTLDGRYRLEHVIELKLPDDGRAVSSCDCGGQRGADGEPRRPGSVRCRRRRGTPAANGACARRRGAKSSSDERRSSLFHSPRRVTAWPCLG